MRDGPDALDSAKLDHRNGVFGLRDSLAQRFYAGVKLLETTAKPGALQSGVVQSFSDLLKPLHQSIS
jgi:hypothetical protein